jgi:hypothetical protein
MDSHEEARRERRVSLRLNTLAKQSDQTIDRTDNMKASFFLTMLGAAGVLAIPAAAPFPDPNGETFHPGSSSSPIAIAIVHL